MAVLNELVALIRGIVRLLIWWYVVQPWEDALRVRAGKRRKRHGPGLHFRIPYVDVIYKQTTRLRWSVLPMQTVTSRDGITFTIAGQLGYKIIDLDKLYDTLQQGENGVRAMGQASIADYVHAHDASECAPSTIQKSAQLDLTKYGLGFEALHLTTFCRVKTMRLITDQHENWSQELLDTMIDYDRAKR